MSIAVRLCEDFACVCGGEPLDEDAAELCEDVFHLPIVTSGLHCAVWEPVGTVSGMGLTWRPPVVPGWLVWAACKPSRAAGVSAVSLGWMGMCVPASRLAVGRVWWVGVLLGAATVLAFVTPAVVVGMFAGPGWSRWAVWMTRGGLRVLSRDGNDTGRLAVARSRRAPTAVLRRLMAEGTPRVAATAARNPVAGRRGWYEDVVFSRPDVLCGPAAQNPAAPERVRAAAAVAAPHPPKLSHLVC